MQVINNRRYCNITRDEMNRHLTSLGYQLIQLPGVYELVYGKVLKVQDRRLTLRIYTSIDSTDSARKCGSDAIRAAVFEKLPTDEIVMVRGAIPVRRTPKWRENLTSRLNELQKRIPGVLPACPDCQAQMRLRESKTGWFYGCSRYPACRGTRSCI